MTLEQLNLIKSSYMKEATRPNGSKSTLGEWMKISLDGGIDLVTSKDLVVFDDSNELVHAVCVNEDMRSQASFPVKIISSEYGMIQQVETIMSQKNFEDFLDSGFLNISQEKKDAMKKWTRCIRNQAQQPMEAEPYFNTNPTVIPKPHNFIKRDKIIVTKAYAIGADGVSRQYATAKEALLDMRDGDILTLNENASMGNNEITLDNGGNVTLDLGGNFISSNAVSAIKVTNGKLTVKNGTITAINEAFRVDTRGEGTAEITLEEDVTVHSFNDCCIFTRGATINTSAALYSDGSYAAIQGNGSDSGSVINITGGIIKAELPIYHPQNGILNISNCTIIGNTAAYIKAGEVNISGGDFNAIGPKESYKFDMNGADPTGDAIVVDFCDYPGGMPKVTITGGTFASLNGKAYETYDKDGNTNPEVAAENVTISGGVFYSKPYLENIAEGSYANHNRVTTKYTIMKTPPTTVVGADGNLREYTTAKEALSDIRDGDSVLIVSDISMDENECVEIKEGVSAEVDLGGNTIYAEEKAFLVSGGKLKLTNGNINSNFIGIRVDSGDGSAELILDKGVTLTSKNGCCLFTKGNNTITTEADMSITGECAAIQGNGSDMSEAVININGGNITSEDNAIYLPSKATVNINGGTITGATGIYMKSGKLNINGGKIIGDGDSNGYAYNGNGGAPTGDALVVDFCGYPAGDPEVAIRGGELISTNAKAYETYDNSGNTNPAIAADNVTIYEGVFNSEPYAENIAEGVCIVYYNNTNIYRVHQ